MTKVLTLAMLRIAFIIMLFFVACGSKKSQDYSTVTVDTVRTQHHESFDLQVRKYEDPKRQTWQDPKFVIEALGDLSDLVIADIGAGTGYFTFQLAVPAKRVIAVDIEQRFLNYIEDRKNEMYDRKLAEKIETRLTTPNSPSFNIKEVDLVLMVNTVGYIKDRDQYLRILLNGMNDNSRIVIVDYKLGLMPVGPSEQAKVGAVEITSALENAGFIVDSIDNQSLQYQYLLKAHKPMKK